MATHRFHYESDPTKGGTWFGERGVRVCDWSWHPAKKILTVRAGRHAKQISLSDVDLERFDPKELGRRLSEAALEAKPHITAKT
jgi:hypothetical protein